MKFSGVNPHLMLYMVCLMWLPMPTSYGGSNTAAVGAGFTKLLLVP